MSKSRQNSAYNLHILKMQYSFEPQCSLSCLITQTAVSAHQAEFFVLQDQNSPNIVAPITFRAIGTKLLYLHDCSLAQRHWAKYSAWASSPNFVAINWASACSVRFPSIRAASCKQQRQHALSLSRLLHTSRPLNPFPLLHHAFTAAKASVFNRNFLDDVASSVASL